MLNPIEDRRLIRFAVKKSHSLNPPGLVMHHVRGFLTGAKMGRRQNLQHFSKLNSRKAYGLFLKLLTISR